MMCDCGEELIGDRCPICDMNKCMDDSTWKQGSDNENKDKK